MIIRSTRSSWGVCTISDGIRRDAKGLRLYVNLVFLAALSLGSYACASDSSNSAIQFSIKPQLCVLNEGEEICRDQLLVSWQSAVALSPCLYRLDQEQSLHCWEQTTAGEYEFKFTTRHTTDFELRAQQSKQLISSQRFQVLFSEKKYRRVRRNPWSFF